MKKTKFLMPILGIGATVVTVTPMVTMTACSKSGWKVTRCRDEGNNLFWVDLKYNKKTDAQTYLYIFSAQIVTAGWELNGAGSFNPINNITNIQIFKQGDPLHKPQKIKVKLILDIVPLSGGASKTAEEKITIKVVPGQSN